MKEGIVEIEFTNDRLLLLYKDIEVVSLFLNANKGMQMSDS